MNSLFTNYVVISNVIQSTIHVVQFSNYVVSRLKILFSLCIRRQQKQNFSLYLFFFKGGN